MKLKSNMTRHGRRTLSALATVGVLAGLATGLSVGGAAADTPGEFKVCAEGNYAAFVQLPQQGGFESFVAFPGTCEEIGIAPGTTYGNVYGIWNTHPDQSFLIATVGLSASTGYTAGAENVTTAPCIEHFNGQPDPVCFANRTPSLADGTLSQVG